MPEQWEAWPDNLPLEEQVERLAAVLLADYEHTFDRSEGAMEKAARLLWESAHIDGQVCDTSAPLQTAEEVPHNDGPRPPVLAPDDGTEVSSTTRFDNDGTTDG